MRLVASHGLAEQFSERETERDKERASLRTDWGSERVELSFVVVVVVVLLGLVGVVNRGDGAETRISWGSQLLAILEETRGWHWTCWCCLSLYSIISLSLSSFLFYFPFLFLVSVLLVKRSNMRLYMVKNRSIYLYCIIVWPKAKIFFF